MILDGFRAMLYSAPGGYQRAEGFWREILETTGQDPNSVASFMENWNSDWLMSFGRPGVICLATDAVENGDLVKLAALCVVGIEMEKR